MVLRGLGGEDEDGVGGERAPHVGQDLLHAGGLRAGGQHPLGLGAHPEGRACGGGWGGGRVRVPDRQTDTDRWTDRHPQFSIPSGRTDLLCCPLDGQMDTSQQGEPPAWTDRTPPPSRLDRRTDKQTPAPPPQLATQIPCAAPARQTDSLPPTLTDSPPSPPFGRTDRRTDPSLPPPPDRQTDRAPPPHRQTPPSAPRTNRQSPRSPSADRPTPCTADGPTDRHPRPGHRPAALPPRPLRHRDNHAPFPKAPPPSRS